MFDAVEINSTFHRPHRATTFQRWFDTTPPGFRFAVKLPKAITHERRLADCGDLLERFLADIAPLGSKLGPLLVQLPPSFAFDPGLASSFFEALRRQFVGAVVLEPRHPTWFTGAAGELLDGFGVSRAAADPACVPEAALPGGWQGMVYLRLHGSPAMYRSTYEPEFIATVAGALQADPAAARWCFFDNTTLGGATGNALALKALLRPSPG